MKKAQGSLEYLLILAAILAIAVVVVLIANAMLVPAQTSASVGEDKYNAALSGYELTGYERVMDASSLDAFKASVPSSITAEGRELQLHEPFCNSFPGYPSGQWKGMGSIGRLTELSENSYVMTHTQGTETLYLAVKYHGTEDFYYCAYTSASGDAATITEDRFRAGLVGYELHDYTTPLDASSLAAFEASVPVSMTLGDETFPLGGGCGDVTWPPSDWISWGATNFVELTNDAYVCFLPSSPDILVAFKHYSGNNGYYCIYT